MKLDIMQKLNSFKTANKRLEQDLPPRRLNCAHRYASTIQTPLRQASQPERYIFTSVYHCVDENLV